ncbi:hypothetical protein [Streptacidiphilus melanogenes]|uniref:hypothetical protein n=1 Tax=Streptacidiphilus melanogenes TaxID=411235 RepID=UPI00126A1B2D|nr:hypothetical protein [Streptacidiphilus melanogenes]
MISIRRIRTSCAIAAAAFGVAASLAAGVGGDAVADSWWNGTPQTPPVTTVADSSWNALVVTGTGTPSTAAPQDSSWNGG